MPRPWFQPPPLAERYPVTGKPAILDETTALVWYSLEMPTLLPLAEAIPQIQALLPDMKPQDVEDLFSPDLTQADRELILEAYKDFKALREVTTWEKVLKIASVCVEIANVVLPLAGALSSVFGVVTAIKAA